MSEDAIFLYEQARRFMEAEPWTRWTFGDAMLLESKQGSWKIEGIARVFGHELTQPGVLLIPGGDDAAAEIAERNQPPAGTLMMQREGAEIQPDLFLRARRYGWPADAH